MRTLHKTVACSSHEHHPSTHPREFGHSSELLGLGFEDGVVDGRSSADTGVAYSLPVRSSQPCGCFERVLGQHFELVAWDLGTWVVKGGEERRAVEARVGGIQLVVNTVVYTCAGASISANQKANTKMIWLEGPPQQYPYTGLHLDPAPIQIS